MHDPRGWRKRYVAQAKTTYSATIALVARTDSWSSRILSTPTVFAGSTEGNHRTNNKTMPILRRDHPGRCDCLSLLRAECLSTAPAGDTDRAAMLDVSGVGHARCHELQSL
jgi:hypothetical protein